MLQQSSSVLCMTAACMSKYWRYTFFLCQCMYADMWLEIMYYTEVLTAMELYSYILNFVVYKSLYRFGGQNYAA